MKFLKKLKQRLCPHIRYDVRWGLCFDCGWANPDWKPPETEFDRMQNPEYRRAFLKHIHMDGARTVAEYAIKQGKTELASQIIRDAHEYEPEEICTTSGTDWGGHGNPKEDLARAIMLEHPLHRECMINAFDPEQKVWSKKERKEMMDAPYPTKESLGEL